VSDWPLVVIAVAVAVMAIVQVAVLVVAARLAQQATRTLAQLQSEIKPILEKATRLSEDATRVSALAIRQVERVDELVTMTTRRVDDTLTVVQGAIIEPVRQGAAVVAAVKAAASVFRGWRQRRATREDDEALFVG